MDRPTQPVRNHHASIMNTLKSFYGFLNDLDSMKGDVSGDELEKYSQFFTGELEPHADGEERELYPAVESLIKEHGSATASMSMDHVALKQHIADFITRARSLANSSGEDSESLRRELIRLGYQIYGVLEIHFAKEEDIYLELMDQHMTPEQVGEIVHKMHHH